MIKVNTLEITYAQYLQIKKLYAIKFMFQWYSHSQVRSHTLCMCMFLHCIQQLVSYWSLWAKYTYAPLLWARDSVRSLYVGMGRKQNGSSNQCHSKNGAIIQDIRLPVRDAHTVTILPVLRLAKISLINSVVAIVCHFGLHRLIPKLHGSLSVLSKMADDL